MIEKGKECECVKPGGFLKVCIERFERKGIEDVGEIE